MKRKGLTIALMILAMLACTGSLAAEDGATLTEQQKIEKLLAAISASKAVFIRNGIEYGADSAVSHMRLKLSRSGGMIRTADQFIEHIATKSSMTGIAYYIKFEDGTKVKSAEWLRARLKEIEGAEACCSLSK